jgi:hypothetical protein
LYGTLGRGPVMFPDVVSIGLVLVSILIGSPVAIHGIRCITHSNRREEGRWILLGALGGGLLAAVCVYRWLGLLPFPLGEDPEERALGGLALIGVSIAFGLSGLVGKWLHVVSKKQSLSWHWSRMVIVSISSPAIAMLSNNGLHQTGREGAAVAFRRRPVVEARPAGEAGCSTELWWRGHNGPEGFQDAK